MTLKLLTEHHLECLSLKAGCTGSSESTLVKLPHCWKSHAMAHLSLRLLLCLFLSGRLRQILLFLLILLQSRPGYLIPFFCLQVFDFCLSCLTVVGYMSYAPNVKLWIVEQGLVSMPVPF